MGNEGQVRRKGDRTMSLGFIAQYAAEACLQTEGVHSLDHSAVASIKESFGVEHEGKGVEVRFLQEDANAVEITCYPNIFFGVIVPEVAWQIQVNVKDDVERFTGLEVSSVNVYVKDIIQWEEESNAH